MFWAKYEDESSIAVAICNYTSSYPHHMKLRVGDVIRITEQNGGWFRGFKFVTPCSRRVFPTNFVVRFIPDRITQLGAEIYSWIPNFQSACFRMDESEFIKLTEQVEKCFPDKKKLQASEMNRKSQDISEIKRMLSLPIEYKNEKDLIRESIMFNKASFLDMYNYHYKEWKINRNSGNQQDIALEHMSVYIKFLELNFERSQLIDDQYEINTILYRLSDDKTRLVRISETHRLKVNAQFTTDLRKNVAIVTKDVQFFPNHKIYIGLQFVRVGPMKNKNESSGISYRRPKGVSLIEFYPACKTMIDEKKKVGIQLVSQKDEFLEPVLERLMPDSKYVNNRTYTNYVELQIKTIKSSSISERDSLLYGLDPYYPSIPSGFFSSSSSLNDSYSYCSNGINRNMLYLTLHHCELDRGIKKSDPNFEVEITLRDNLGQKVKASNDLMDFNGHTSVVYYHQSRCFWIEMVSIPLLDDYEHKPHLRFVISHRSLRNSSKGHPGVAYLRLFPDQDSGAFVSDCKNDNYHTLNVIRMNSDLIEKCEYLNPRYNNVMGSLEKFPIQMPKTKMLPNWKSNKKQAKEIPEFLYVQTQLCSYEYTSDDLIANLCCGREISATTVKLLCEEPAIETRKINHMELKKLYLKVLDRCLLLLQKAVPSDYLGRNLMAILAEMFLVIRNYPEHQVQLNNFIHETKHFQIHIPILTELTKNHTDEMFIRAADWFIKIAVKSFENNQNSVTHNSTDNETFATLVNEFLHNLEMISQDTSLHKLRAHVGKQTGPIMNALTQLCGDPQFHLAQFIDHLLENFSDLEARCVSDLTMEVIHSKLFSDSEFRRRIVPRTTMIILAMCKAQMKDVQTGSESKQFITLDSVCEKLINFMVAHERNWARASVSEKERQDMVKELLIDTRLFRQMIEIVGQMFEFVEREDNCHMTGFDNSSCVVNTGTFNARTSYISTSSSVSTSTLNTMSSTSAVITNTTGTIGPIKQYTSTFQQLQSPLMVLVSTVVCCIHHLSESQNLMRQMVDSESSNCILCGKLCVTNVFDFVQEIVGFISMLQKHTVFPQTMVCSTFSAVSASTSSNSKQKRPWTEMLFLQTKILLTALSTLDDVFLEIILIMNLKQYQNLQSYPKNWPSSGAIICNCHPPVSEQMIMVRQFAETVSEIILQPFLCIENIPGLSAVRILENFGDLREVGAQTIKKIWDSLGILKQQFSQTFMPIFGSMTTIKNYSIRLIAAQGLLDMIHLNRTVHTMGLITEIDQAMEKSNDESYCSEMTKALKEAVQLTLQQASRRPPKPLPNQAPVPEVAARAGLTNIAEEDFQLVERIIYQMTYIQECSQHLQDESPISGMIVINNLRKFYKSMGRSDIISRYLMKLLDRLASIKNRTEMGFTLRELSTFYQWSEEEVDPAFFPREYWECTTSWMMKAKLLESSLTYFDYEDWETGIEVCKELVQGYSTYAVDFQKLSEIYKRMSEYSRRIIRENRPKTNYFVIFYLGEGFPKFVSDLQNRAVLFRSKCSGPEIEGELKIQFPGVQLKRGFPPDDYLETMAEEQLIQYVPVSPYKPTVPEIYQNKPVKQRIIQYYCNYQLNRFSFTDLLNRTEDNVEKKKYRIRSVLIEGKMPNILSVAPITKICPESSKPYIVSLSALEQRLDIDEVMYDDFQLASLEEQKKMYNTVTQTIIGYYAPVSGGVKKIMTMIRDDPETHLYKYQKVFTRMLNLIYNLLQLYDAFEGLSQYETILHEYEILVDFSTDIFDYGFDEEFNCRYLLETYKKMKEPNAYTSTANRRPSIVSRIDESSLMTLTRRRPHIDALDERQELGSERQSITSDESGGSGVLPRARNTSFSNVSISTGQYRPPSQTELMISSNHFSHRSSPTQPLPVSNNNNNNNSVSMETPTMDTVTRPMINSTPDHSLSNPLPQVPPRPTKNQMSSTVSRNSSAIDMKRNKR